MGRRIKAVVLAFVWVVVGACGSDDGDDQSQTGTSDVVTTVAADGRFSVFAQAIAAAGLEATLKAPGPFTLFAPTDAAFATALTEHGLTREQLFDDTELVTSVVAYHVLVGAVTSANLPSGTPIVTLRGEILQSRAALQLSDGRNRAATLVTPDIAASNGVMHAVDSVLLPANRDIVETCEALGLSIMVQALNASSLGTTLHQAGPYTLFAPTDTAFADLLTELNLTKAQLLADAATLNRILGYHVVTGRSFAKASTTNSPLVTLESGTISVDANLLVTDARARAAQIVASDVLARNGVLHTVNKVLLPAP